MQCSTWAPRFGKKVFDSKRDLNMRWSNGTYENNFRLGSVNKWKNCTVYLLYEQFFLGFGFSKGSQSGVNVREFI